MNNNDPHTDNTHDPATAGPAPEVQNREGVRRLNNLPMYILGGVVGSFLLIMMVVAADRAEQHETVNEEPLGAGTDTLFFAKQIADQHPQYAAVPETGAPEPTLLPPQSPATTAAAQPAPPTLPPPALPQQQLSSAPPSATSAEAARISQLKQRMLEEAVRAKTSVVNVQHSGGGQNSGARGQAPSMPLEPKRSTDPTAVYQARLAQMQGAPATRDNSSAGSAPVLVTQNSEDPYGRLRSGGSDRWQLDSTVQSPRSPFELQTGFVIPATMLSGINSDLPGQIMAQVSHDVYDTATGRHRLIPQGSRLVGAYSSEVSYGQQRVLVAWQRIVFPDGKTMDIGSMPGADGAGYSGFKDRINHHYLQIFGAAFLMSGITAGITLTQRDALADEQNGRQRAGDIISEALGQQIGQVAIDMIRRHLNISPTLEIRPGYRFNVIVTKDMTFSKPYDSFDY